MSIPALVESGIDSECLARMVKLWLLYKLESQGRWVRKSLIDHS